MKKQLILVFCILHFCAIFWWSAPYSYGYVLTSGRNDASGQPIKHWLTLARNPHLASFLHAYINVTGSQQYWDFFAPHSIKYHQYLSVCTEVDTAPELERLSCKGQTLFTNLEKDFTRFHRFGSERSRLYRLTENLIKLNDVELLSAFSRYYSETLQSKRPGELTVPIIAHYFELHPELQDLPKAGYHWDTLLSP